MWDPWADERASEGLRGRLQWFLLGRVAIISCFLGSVGFLYLQGGVEHYGIPVNQLLFVIAITYGFSMVSGLLLERVRRLAVFTYVQIGFDVLLITGVIFLTGGVISPFPFLYSLPVINGAALLLGRGAVASALMCALAYDGLVLALLSGTVISDWPFAHARLTAQSGLTLATTNLSLFLVAYLASVLARRLNQMEELIQERQSEHDRLTLLQETLGRTIDSALVTTDADGRIQSVTNMADNLQGIWPEKVVGKEIGAVFPPLQLTASARLRLLQAAAALEPIEFKYEKTDRSTGQLRCTAAPLRNTYGSPIGALYVLQDVTRLKELEEAQTPIETIETLYRDEIETANESAETSDGLIGVSPAIGQIRKMIDRVAASDATVLITGESGTGKELVARAVHAHSPRRDRPFIAINCAAIPENLIESELFGHVRGAFTGAVSDREGCFRAADSGSIFLDEIGDLPLHLQVKLLRVLQERVFRPVGSETAVAVNVRIIAATNRDLQAQVRDGKFREDLFYRLNVITLELPPLRERREDIPILVRHFLRQLSDLHGRHVSRFSTGASRILLQHGYPGNIRELENIVEHAVAMCDRDTATEEHLPAYLNGKEGPAVPKREPAPSPVVPTPASSSTWTPSTPAIQLDHTIDLDQMLADYEKSVLMRALDRTGGVKKRAADLLGINYRSLRHRLQKYGLAEAAEAD